MYSVGSKLISASCSFAPLVSFVILVHLVALHEKKKGSKSTKTVMFAY